MLIQIDNTVPEPQVLSGQHVRLDPLIDQDIDGLLTAATEDRETYGFTNVPANRVAMRSYVDTAITEQRSALALPYVVRRRGDGRVVGCTRIFDFARWSGREFPDAAEIGHTWYAASAQRTACNTETKLLLLTLLFEQWHVERVTLKTDARNARSRAAILRLGAQFEGIRRAHQLATDGTIRDTAYYSIVAAEWPSARKGLRTKLSR